MRDDAAGYPDAAGVETPARGHEALRERR